MALLWRVSLLATTVLLATGATIPDDAKKQVKVELSQGIIQGELQTAGPSRHFYAFYGIPYAKPPVEEHRLKVS